MKARFLLPIPRVDGTVAYPGMVIEDPEAYILVRLGVAEPADEECENAHGMTSEQLRIAQAAAVRREKGIQPEDYADFDAGRMAGYNANGQPIPGPFAGMDDATIEEDLSMPAPSFDMPG